MWTKSHNVDVSDSKGKIVFKMPVSFCSLFPPLKRARNEIEFESIIRAFVRSLSLGQRYELRLKSRRYRFKKTSSQSKCYRDPDQVTVKVLKELFLGIFDKDITLERSVDIWYRCDAYLCNLSCSYCVSGANKIRVPWLSKEGHERFKKVVTWIANLPYQIRIRLQTAGGLPTTTV